MSVMAGTTEITSWNRSQVAMSEENAFEKLNGVGKLGQNARKRCHNEGRCFILLICA